MRAVLLINENDGGVGAECIVVRGDWERRRIGGQVK